MKHRVLPCAAATIDGRLARAIELYEVGEELRRLHPERANAWVTSYVLAGTAAADVICCRALGHHSPGDNHAQAVALLRTVQPDGPELSTALGVLLGMKTAAGDGQRPVSAQDQARAARRAKQLVDAARQRA